jgi:hypothetical protein
MPQVEYSRAQVQSIRPWHGASLTRRVPGITTKNKVQPSSNLKSKNRVKRAEDVVWCHVARKIRLILSQYFKGTSRWFDALRTCRISPDGSRIKTPVRNRRGSEMIHFFHLLILGCLVFCCGCRQSSRAQAATVLADFYIIRQDLEAIDFHSPDALKWLVAQEGRSLEYRQLQGRAREVRRGSRFFLERDGEKVAVTDLWGNPYIVRTRIRKRGTPGPFQWEVDLISFGPNGRDEDGKGDDIVLTGTLIAK